MCLRSEVKNTFNLIYSSCYINLKTYSLQEFRFKKGKSFTLLLLASSIPFMLEFYLHSSPPGYRA